MKQKGRGGEWTSHRVLTFAGIVKFDLFGLMLTWIHCAAAAGFQSLKCARRNRRKSFFCIFLPISRGVSERCLLQHLSPPVSGAKHLYKWNGAVHSAPRLSSTFVRCASAVHLLVKQSPLANTNHPLVPIYSENNLENILQLSLSGIHVLMFLIRNDCNKYHNSLHDTHIAFRRKIRVSKFPRWSVTFLKPNRRQLIAATVTTINQYFLISKF